MTDPGPTNSEVADRLKYIANMLEQIGNLIPPSDSILLSYLISMAHEETLQQLRISPF